MKRNAWGFKIPLLIIVFLFLAVTLVGCGASSTTSKTSKTSTSSTSSKSSTVKSGTSSANSLLVWVDAPRVPAVKAFEKANPNIKVKSVLISDNIGSDQLRGKFDLFNKVGSGWPDAIFFPTNSDISWAATKPISYCADLTNLVPKSIQNGYPPAVAAAGTYNGKLYALRNDVGADVLWYNAKLFKKWGYTPPTTWPQYEQLGLKIAKDHPGYFVGLIGTTYTFDRYFWGSAVPANTLVGPNTVKIDVGDSNGMRMVNLLDTLLKAKVLSVTGLFSQESIKVGPKVVMTPGALWYGDYLFKGEWHDPAGEVSASAPLHWPGAELTGDEGGGLWGLSSHISGQKLQNALKFIEFMGTNPAWQVNLSPCYPAYSPDDAGWFKQHVVSSGYYVNPTQMKAAFDEACKEIWTGHPYTQFDPDAIWDSVVAPALAKGKTIKEVWPTFQSNLVHYAKLYNYKVVTQ